MPRNILASVFVSMHVISKILLRLIEDAVVAQIYERGVEFDCLATAQYKMQNAQAKLYAKN